MSRKAQTKSRPFPEAVPPASTALSANEAPSAFPASAPSSPRPLRLTKAAATQEPEPFEEAASDRIERLGSPDKARRDEALEALYESSWKDGALTPFVFGQTTALFELLSLKKLPEPEDLLFYLAHLLTGGQGPSIVPEGTAQKHDPLFANLLALFAEKGDLLQACLRSSLPDLRLHTACVLSSLHHPSIPSDQWLFQAFQKETEPTIRAGLLLGLGLWLAKKELKFSERTAFWNLFQEALEDKGAPILRLVAGISLVRWFPDTPPQGAIHAILQTMILPEVSDVYAALPWSEGDVVGDCSRLFMSLPSAFAATFLEPLRQVLPIVDPYSALQVVRALLSLTTAEAGQPSSAERIASLDAIVLCETPWILQQGIREILTEFDLPSQRPALRAFLRHLQASSEGTLIPK